VSAGGIDARDVAALAKALRGSTPRVRKELPRRMRRAGLLVLSAAKRNASWSSRIPGAIGMRTVTAGNKAGLLLRANASKAPHGRAYEGLQRGARAGSFRRQVYGKAWVTQKTRPFLVPAVNANREAVQDEISLVVDDVAALAGFRRR
jgi:lysozyme family protein